MNILGTCLILFYLKGKNYSCYKVKWSLDIKTREFKIWDAIKMDSMINLSKLADAN